MSYTLEVVADEGYLLLRHEGEVSREEVRASRAALLEALTRSQVGRILIDCGAVSRSPAPTEIYFLIGETTVLPAMRSKCAFVASESSIAGFVEDVARNRGIELSAFTSRDTALAWLLGNDN